MSVLVSLPTSARRGAVKPAEVKAHGCQPAFCALGAQPHQHCVCGLPMALDAVVCQLCVEEGLVLDQVVARIDAEEWDGSYPSRRRLPFADTENYVLLLEAVYQPAAGKGTRA